MGLVKIGVLWDDKFDKDGNQYLSGKLEGLINCKIIAFKTKPRDGQTLSENAPGLTLFADDGEDNR